MMEALGTIYEEQWSNITSEEADFMAQLLGNFATPNEDEAPITDPNFLVSSAFCPSHETVPYSVDRSTFCSSDDQINNISFRFPDSGQEIWQRPPSNASRRFLVNNDDFELSGEKLSEEASYEKLIREYDAGGSMEKSKKRQRIPSEFQRTKKSMKTCGKLEDHKSNNTYSSHCSGDDSNASLDPNGVGSISTSKGCEDMNLPKKKRAGRGSATDPQSLYARKRREKINERLRILQNLVPNGTKVDISTMLEEAVQYVKFLQLQIKLLSSDDMWMYAPIAYNGMDLGLDLKISTPTPEP